MVAPQLAERSLPTSEVHSSNSAIGKFYKERFFIVNNGLNMTKIKKNRSRMDH